MYFFDKGHMGTIEVSHVFHRQNHGVLSIFSPMMILWIWVNSPGIMAYKGNHPLLWPQDSGE